MPPGVGQFPIQYSAWTGDDAAMQLWKLTNLQYNVKDYGAKGDGVADDKDAIQRAVNACSAQAAQPGAGGVVFFPPGVYNVSGAITVYDTKIRGTGRGAAKIFLVSGANSDVFATPDDGTQRYWFDIADIQIDGNAAGQAGGTALINLRGMNEARINNVRLVNPYNNGIRIGQATGGMFCTVPIITECLIRGDVATPPLGSGIDADSGSSDCIIAENDIGYFTNGAGVLLSGHNGGELVGNQCWQCKHGFQLFQANRMRLVGNLADLAKVYGFVIQESSDVQVIGCQARESSILTVNTYDGFFVEGHVGGPVATDIMLVGCRAFGSQARYGLAVNQQLNRVRVVGCNFTGNSTGTILVGATAVTNLSTRESMSSVEALTYSASITPDANVGETFTIVATNGTAFTINNPTNPVKGYKLTLDIKNSSGGAHGVITWGAGFLNGGAGTVGTGAFAGIANGKRRTISFYFDGTSWIELFRTADI